MLSVPVIHSTQCRPAGGTAGPPSRGLNFNRTFVHRAFPDNDRSTTDVVDTTQQLNTLKDALFASTSGLDRGLDASGIEVAQQIEQVIMEMCALSPAPRLDLDEEAFGGTWQLRYSSEFVPGNTKFAGNWPFLANSDTLRQATKPLLPKIVDVQQVIDVYGKRLDNVVTLELRPPVISDFLAERIGPAPRVIATLEHDYRISGAATVTITFEKTIVQGQGGVNGWFGNLPQITWGGGDNAVLEEIRKATEAYNSSSFDVVYLDSKLRVTRADRGEVRVFVREN